MSKSFWVCLILRRSNEQPKHSGSEKNVTEAERHLISGPNRGEETIRQNLEAGGFRLEENVFDAESAPGWDIRKNLLGHEAACRLRADGHETAVCSHDGEIERGSEEQKHHAGQFAVEPGEPQKKEL